VDGQEFTDQPNIYQGGGLQGAGYHVARAARRHKVTGKAVGGFACDVRQSGMGALVDQLFGSAPTPTQMGATTVYSQTHVLAALGANKGATIQVGLTEAESGTVNPYSYLGSRMLEFTLTQDSAADAPLKIETTWDCQALTQAEALTSFTAPTVPAYHLGQFGFRQHNTPGSEAAVAGVRGGSITVARPQDVERYCANMAGLRRAPVLNGREEVVTGSIMCDYMLKADFADRFIAQTEFSQVWEWVGPVLDVQTALFRVTLPACYLLGPLPPSDGAGVVSGEFAFAVTDDDSTEPITITIQSLETTL
jgi:hypothetical protein